MALRRESRSVRDKQCKYSLSTKDPTKTGLGWTRTSFNGGSWWLTTWPSHLTTDGTSCRTQNLLHGAGTELRFRHAYNPIFPTLVKLHRKPSFKIRNGQIIVLYQELFDPLNQPRLPVYVFVSSGQRSQNKTTTAVTHTCISDTQHSAAHTKILHTEARK